MKRASIWLLLCAMSMTLPNAMLANARGEEPAVPAGASAPEAAPAVAVGSAAIAVAAPTPESAPFDIHSIDLEPIDAEPLTEPLEAPGLDLYAGRTVRSMHDGYGIIAARGGKVPKVGQPAPLFALKTADGKETIRLADYFGKKPVVLVFGSLT